MSENPTGSVSDGFHTFVELYMHRMRLTAAWFKTLAALCAVDAALSDRPWRSLLHHDGEAPFDGQWFIVGVTLGDIGQVTYHYPLEDWNAFDLPGVDTLNRAEPWDGHTSEQALDRIREWTRS